MARLKRKYVIILISLILILLTCLNVYFFRNAHKFLALNRPIESKILVVEGWMPDYALERVKSKFEESGYQLLITTGGPLSRGSFLSEYKTYAELAASTLRAIGFSSEKLSAVTCPKVRKDRTFASAVALKKWFEDNSIKETKFNVVSLGTHARRTRLLFRKAFGREFSIGIIAIRNEDYNPRRWWSSSSGVRSVLNEFFAYFYAAILFREKDSGTAISANTKK